MRFHWMMAAALLGTFTLRAEVPDAKGSERIAEHDIVGGGDRFEPGEVSRLDGEKVQLTVTTDRSPVEYHVGDPMIFTITADLGGQPQPTNDCFIVWDRTGDDGRTEQGKAKLADGPATVSTSIDRPGFVRLRVSLADENGKKVKKTFNIWGREEKREIFFDGGAGADLAGITQAAPEPADFDAFWRRQKARLAAVPLKYRMDRISTANGIDAYAVSIDCAGPRPVTGYLTVPENAAPKSLPARVMFQGYGVGKQGPQGGSRDEIQFIINAHGYELGKDDAYYAAFAESIQSNGMSYAFDPKQNANPEEAYFNGMTLRLMRALEFVKTLPQWDGKELIACGGSQGGLQTIWAAALDPDVTCAESEITWCCNLAGNGLYEGWYVPWVEPLGYYDAVNHAKRIKCPVVITRAGLGDYICPPAGLAVLYNNIAAPKKITWVQGSDHGYVPPNPERFAQEQE